MRTLQHTSASLPTQRDLSCASSVFNDARAVSTSASPREQSLYDFPPHVQDRVRARMAIMDEISRTVPRSEAIQRIASLGIPGLSLKSLYRLHQQWMETNGDWTILLDKREWADLWDREDRQAALPAEFLRYAGGLMLENQRKSRPAWRTLLRQWESWLAGDPGKAIPGYDVCPPPGPGRSFPRHPLGWSYANLMRRAQPPKAERVIARIGTVAAKSLLPCVPGTRVGARWLEYIFWDDVWLDRKVIVPGKSMSPVRVLQLGGLDYATGLYLKFGQRPFLPDEEGKRDGLKRRDFLALVAAFLDEFGFPADYAMHLICERGTATMSQAEARVLYDVSGGRIKVCYTSMQGQMVLAWEESKSGNSTGKGPLESWHNLFHNEAAAIPGQMGKDRASAPALMAAQERETTSLVKIGAMLPADIRARLVAPHPTMDQCYAQTLDLVARINARHDHALEGFDAIPVWRFPGEAAWHTEDDLVRVNPAVLDSLEWTTRAESPMERRARLAAGVRMVRLPSNIWPRFYEDSHALARVNRAQIEVKLDGRTILFGPADPSSAIPDGTEVLAYFAPNNPSKAYITINGRFAGCWSRLARVARGDQAALADSMRRKHSFLNEAASNVRTSMAEHILANDARMAANQQIIETATQSITTIPAETPAATALQSMSRAIANDQQASEKAAQKADADAQARVEQFMEDAFAPADKPADAPDTTEDFLKDIL